MPMRKNYTNQEFLTDHFFNPDANDQEIMQVVHQIEDKEFLVDKSILNFITNYSKSLEVAHCKKKKLAIHLN